MVTQTQALFCRLYVIYVTQLHTTCFHESDVVFEDKEGSAIFGCDCGQFHPGVGVSEGVFELRAGMQKNKTTVL